MPCKLTAVTSVIINFKISFHKDVTRYVFALELQKHIHYFTLQSGQPRHEAIGKNLAFTDFIDNFRNSSLYQYFCL
jgi:hypothetical protein